MNLTELAALVKRMREAQAAYFRSKSPAALDLSKRLERQVDDALRSVLEPDLFAPEENAR